jgi:carbonic anhydrase
MSDLLSEAPRFRVDYFQREAELMGRLAREGQTPGTMMITCSDSRVVPELIMGAKPGELFVLRLVANVVPPFGTGEVAVGAALEYAVRLLGVSHLILCGHLDCGGIRALDEGIDMAAEPNTHRWLAWARPAQTHIDAHNISDPDERHRRIVETNVLFQLANLQTYDPVREALAADRLELHGWVFDIGSGKVWSYDPASEVFALVKPENSEFHQNAEFSVGKKKATHERSE